MTTTRFHPARFALVFAPLAALTAIPILLPAQAPPATAPARLTPAPKAIAYYDAACRRCHGPEGSFYGPELGKTLTDAQLIHVVDDMARGPAQEPLDPPGLAAQTAFHRAIIAGDPYLSVTGIQPAELSGEVSAEAAVSVALPNVEKPLPATVSESSWKVALPPNTPLAGIRLTAERAGRRTTLSLAAAPLHSHASLASPPTASQPASRPSGGSAR